MVLRCYLFADSTDSLCGPLAQPDSVEEIHFSGDHDQASDFYRAVLHVAVVVSYLANSFKYNGRALGPWFYTTVHTNYYFHSEPQCPAFIVEGSTQKNWADSPAGTTATIGCAANHILMGNATLTVTCQQDGSWSLDVPQRAGTRSSAPIHDTSLAFSSLRPWMGGMVENGGGGRYLLVGLYQQCHLLLWRVGVTEFAECCYSNRVVNLETETSYCAALFMYLFLTCH
eukprot:sb/3469548/